MNPSYQTVSAYSLEATELRSEYSKSPLGIDAKIPRLSWVLRSDRRRTRQNAYQILVADSLKVLAVNVSNVWDSGKVLSDRTFSIEYGGPELQSRKRYFWKVKVWDDLDASSEFSETHWWEMGLLHEEDWNAKWIEGGKIFKTTFQLHSKSTRARAYITSTGYYELRVNGRKIGDRVLDPAPTAPEKRIYYATYELENYLRAGENAIVIFAGRTTENGNAVLAQIEADQNGEPLVLVGTDENWITSENSPIVSAGLYDGETYDARLDDFLQKISAQPSGRAKLADSSSIGRMVSSASFPPIRVTGSLKAVNLTTPKPFTTVFDFGQNFSGWVRLHVRGPSGTKVTVRYAELLNPDGTINPGTNRAAKATDIYILNESQENYEPHFTYHGFRFVEVSGFPGVPTIDSFEGRIVHTDVETVGSFLCSNDLINKIHEMTVWSQQSNLHGIPTDSPQRDERLGWLQDAMLSAEEAMMNFDMCGIYEKLLIDISDSQGDDGSLPDVVPSRGERYPADSSCGASYIAIAYYLYLFYGDRRCLEDHYEGMKKWVEFEEAKATNYVLNMSKYGDWCSPAHVKPIETPGELISTFWFFQNAQSLSEISRILDKKDDSERFRILSNKIKEAFNAKFLAERQDREYAHAEDYKFYGYGLSQTCNILPLYAGMVPDEKLAQVIAGLMQDIAVSRDGHLNTGIIGTRFLFHTLTKYGKSELAYRVLTQTSYPSYGYMIREGATTLWERWEYLTGSAMNSHNHIMLGSLDGWLFDTIGGIYPDSPGFAHFKIRPFIPDKLEHASISIGTVSGLVACNWKKVRNSDETILELEVIVPANSSALVQIPRGMSVESILFEGETNLSDLKNAVENLPAGVSKFGAAQEYFECEVGSGAYNFKVRNFVS